MTATNYTQELIAELRSVPHPFGRGRDSLTSRTVAALEASEARRAAEPWKVACEALAAAPAREKPAGGVTLTEEQAGVIRSAIRRFVPLGQQRGLLALLRGEEPPPT